MKGSTGLNRPLVRLSQIVLFLKKFVISRYDIRSNYVGQLKEIAVQLEYPFDLKTNKNKLRANPIKIPVPCLPNNFCGRCQDKIKFIESKLSSLTYRPNATVSASQFDSKSIRRRLNSAIMVEWITRRCIRNVHQFPNLHKKKIDSVDAFCAFFFTVNS